MSFAARIASVRWAFCVAPLAAAIWSTDATACSCRTDSLAERFARAHMVVVAEVTGVAPLREVTLRPREVLKGRPGKTLRIPTGESDCDFFLPPLEPRVGEAYLLYVGRSNGRLHASRCQNSGLAAERAAELRALRGARRVAEPQR